jgi:acyl-coenzyme A thioesterase PaaI-like protein
MTSLLRKLFDKLPISLFRIGANLWLPFLGAGIKIKNISPDFNHVEVTMKLHWYNSNYIGTHFGGSIYAMTDAFFVIMLIKNLGRGYIVWDKSAKIEYKKPGKGKLTVIFKLNNEEIQLIKNKTDESGKYIFDIPVNVTDESGDIVAEVTKTIYVRKKS